MSVCEQMLIYDSEHVNLLRTGVIMGKIKTRVVPCERWTTPQTTATVISTLGKHLSTPSAHIDHIPSN
jgi:hypothetical protein